MYIKFINGESTFPYGPQMLLEENPKTIFELPLSDATLAAYGVFPVRNEEEPEFDQATHRAELSAPALVGDEWVRAWTLRVATPDEVAEHKAAVGALKSNLAAKIDDAVAAKITKSTRFAMGYQEREAAAIAYKARGYSGDPTVWITGFAEPAGMTPPAAADLILSQAEALRAALRDLEALRMKKYIVARATSIEQAQAAAEAILADVRAIVIP